jgi:cytochrome c/quinol oxidase subunit I
MWTERWFLSCNAKDIGILYLIFALFSGLIGTAFSVLIRLELAGPGVQYIADNQLYNSIITAHAILMIFFMVEKSLNVLNMESQPSLDMDMENDSDNNNVVEIGNDNNNNDDKDPKKPKYVKVIVNDP